MNSQQSMFYPSEQSTNKQQQERNKAHDQMKKPGMLRRNLTTIVLVLTLIILFSAFTILRAVGDHVQKTVTEPTVNYAVQSAPHLVIHADGGDVSIHGGSGTNIVIKATKHLGIFDGGTSNADITTHQNGDTVDVTTQVENYFSLLGGGRSYVSLDITVPTSSNIQLNESAGNITLDTLNGPVALHTDAGKITLNNAKLSGQSSATSDRGNITFNGSLDPQGTYQFTTKAGNINLTLPGNDAINVHAQSTAGKVQNDFGDSSTGAPVNVNTQAGDITIQKQ